MYVRYPLSLRNVEDLLHERGIDISHETVRFWWNRFGPLFAAEIRKKRSQQLRAHSNWQWHLDEVFVKINGETHYLRRAVDHEGEVLESFVTKRRDRKAALKFLRKTIKRFGPPHVIVTDLLRSYGAAMKVVDSGGQRGLPMPAAPISAIRLDWAGRVITGQVRRCLIHGVFYADRPWSCSDLNRIRLVLAGQGAWI